MIATSSPKHNSAGQIYEAPFFKICEVENYLLKYLFVIVTGNLLRW